MGGPFKKTDLSVESNPLDFFDIIITHKLRKFMIDMTIFFKDWGIIGGNIIATTSHHNMHMELYSYLLFF